MVFDKGDIKNKQNLVNYTNIKDKSTNIYTLSTFQ